MKYIFTQISLILLLLSVLFSCKTSNKENDTPNDIVYDSISVAEIYHLDNDSTKPSCSLNIKYRFPAEYPDAEILAKIQGELNFSLLEDEKYEKINPGDAVKKYIEDYIANYKKEAKERFSDWQASGDPEEFFSYYKVLDGYTVFDKGGLLSYQISSMDYKGGAGSVTMFRNIVFDLSTGNMVKEEDIFVPEYKNILNPLLTQKIIEQNNVKTAEDLLDLGYWVEDLTSNNNFYVDDKGITYIFNPFEYSAATLGEIRIFLPYKEVNEILKRESPISDLSGI